MFTFTPLLGAHSASPASQSLLELDGGVKILVDVGWDDAFDAADLHALEQHVSSLSLILLTHPTLAHLGAYAHCCKHIPLFAKIPVYATTPVINLGRTLLADLYASSPLAASIIPLHTIGAAESSPKLLLDPPTPDEIGSYFSLINPLKYSQPHQPIPSPFSPPLAGLTITAYGAGHTLGGTIWHLQHGLESIVYAADWNQGRENLFAGAAWLSGGSDIIEPLRRPTALICSANGVEKSGSGNLTRLSRKKRDDTLISLVRETIAQGGKVLIPTDSSARVLELAFLLNQTWRDNIDGPHADTYKNAQIYMASRSSTSSVRYLSSMLEWLDDGVRGEAEAAMTKGDGQGKGQSTAVNPLDWKHVKPIERRSQVERAVNRARPCVMLASDASMDWGFSRQALQTLAGDPRNLVIMTEKASALPHHQGRGSSVGRELWDAFHSNPGHTSAQSGAKVVNADGLLTLELQDTTTTSLTADELALYQTYAARQQQLHSSLQGDNALLSNGADPTNATTDTLEQEDPEEDDDSSSDEEDEDAEHQGRALNLSAQLTHRKTTAATTPNVPDAELGVNVLLRPGKKVFDYDVRGKRGREKVFPFVSARVRDDDFGQLIRPEEYLRAEERDAVDGVDMRGNNIGGGKSESAVGLKRKWDDASASAGGGGAGGKGRRAGGGGRGEKRQRRGDGAPDDIDAAIARATGQNGHSAATRAEDGKSDAESTDEEAESDYEPADDDSAGPRKLVFETKSLEVKCRIAYVDFAGLAERRDLLMLVPLIRPRKLVFIGGASADEDGVAGETVAALAEECRRLLGGGQGEGQKAEVFAPRVGERVDASVDTHAWTVKLGRGLVRRLVWQEVKGVGVVAVTGRLGPGYSAVGVKTDGGEEVEAKKRKKLKMIRGDEEEAGSDKPAAEDNDSGGNALAVKSPAAPDTTPAALPVLDLLAPSQHTPTTHQHHQTRPSVHVGDLRLAALRALLTSSGHLCEFRGEGTLLVDGTVVVRKLSGEAAGRVEVEADVRGLLAPQGWVTRDGGGTGSFFAVRRAVYGGLAVVGGV